MVLELNGYYINGHVLRTQLKDPEAVKSKWNTNSDLIALDKRIRLKGKPKERLRDAPAHSGAVKRAALKKVRLLGRFTLRVGVGSCKSSAAVSYPNQSSRIRRGVCKKSLHPLSMETEMGSANNASGSWLPQFAPSTHL